MTLPATDAFTDSNNTSLFDHSSSWTDQCTTSGAPPLIQSNRLTLPSSTNLCGGYWNEDSFNANQYSKAEFYLVSAFNVYAVSCRCSGANSTRTAYAIIHGSHGQHELVATVNDSDTSLSTDGSTASSGEEVTIKANGTTISWELEGVEQASVTDSSISSGAAGHIGYGAGTAAGIDNWEGGDLGGGAPSLSIPVAMRHFRNLRT